MRRMFKKGRRGISAVHTFIVPCGMARGGTHPVSVAVDDAGLAFSISCACSDEDKEIMAAAQALDGEVFTTCLLTMQDVVTKIAVKGHAGYPNEQISLEKLACQLRGVGQRRKEDKGKYPPAAPAIEVPPELRQRSLLHRVARQMSRVAGFPIDVRAPFMARLAPVELWLGNHSKVAAFQEVGAAFKWVFDDTAIMQLTLLEPRLIKAQIVDRHVDHVSTDGTKLCVGCNDGMQSFCQVCNEQVQTKHKKHSSEAMITRHQKSAGHRRAIVAGIHRAMRMFKARKHDRYFNPL
jgi:hypothetical protein